MGKNIILIGFMGTGKTSIGSRLSQKLKMNFVDMDREIEKLLGIDMVRIFKVYGEKRLRSEETLLLRKLAGQDKNVIATGGGLLLNDVNREVIRRAGVLVRLIAEPHEIWERIQRKKVKRPMLAKIRDIDEMIKIMSDTEKDYEIADINIETSGKDLDVIVNEIISALYASDFADN
ncbi:MAG: AAA family ATPase [Syntrophomonadaceae bacterium]|nr:AAA family ATPase [Syntrophomonadaceae bacterium]